MLDKLKRKLDDIANATRSEISSFTVSTADRAERLTICDSCESQIKTTKVCKRCGCLILAKSHLSSASCPLGKWPIIVIAKNSEE